MLTIFIFIIVNRSRMSNTDEVVRRSKSKSEIFNNLSKEDVEKYQEAFSVSFRT